MLRGSTRSPVPGTMRSCPYPPLPLCLQPFPVPPCLSLAAGLGARRRGDLPFACSDLYLPVPGNGITLPDRLFFMRHQPVAVSYTHLRAHETPEHLVCRLLLEKKK